MRTLLLFFLSHRLLAIARWDFHFIRLRFLNAVLLRSRAIRRTVATKAPPLFLNLGSGPRGLDHPHWINVDGFRDTNVHHLTDLSRPLPFADSSFDGVFCEHVLEHFSPDDGEALACEVWRVLRPGGHFRVVVPDAERIMRSYFDAPDALVARRGEASATPMQVVNTYFRQRYEHQFLYDWTTLQTVLLRAGFGKVSHVMPRQGTCTALLLDDPKYEWESLYVEAQR